MLKRLGLILLLITTNGVSMASKENGMIVESEKLQEKEEREFIKEIKAVTKGKGIFSVIVTNDGKYGELVEVSVRIVNPPLSCKDLESKYSGLLGIETNETATIELPVPLVSSQGWNWSNGDFESYDNTDNLLPLPENSEVIIEVKNTIPRDHLETKVYGPAPQYLKSFKANYLSGTRFVELPSEISFTVNFDLIPLPHFRELVDLVDEASTNFIHSFFK